MSGKNAKIISIRENVAIRLLEVKGYGNCWSWSDAIDSLFGVIEEQNKYILELKGELNDKQPSKDNHLS